MRSENKDAGQEDREAEAMKQKLRDWIQEKKHIGPHRTGLIDIYFAEYVSKAHSLSEAFDKTKFMLRQVGFEDVMCEWNKWLNKDMSKEDKEAVGSLWETNVKEALVECEWDSDEAFRCALKRCKDAKKQEKDDERRARDLHREINGLEPKASKRRKRDSAAAETNPAAAEGEGQSSEAASRPSRGSLDKEPSDDDGDAAGDDGWMSEYLDEMPREEEGGPVVVNAALKLVLRAKADMKKSHEEGRKWAALYVRLLSAAILASHTVEFCPESNSAKPKCKQDCDFCNKVWAKIDLIKKEKDAFLARQSQ